MSTKQNPPGWREVDGVKLPEITWAERANSYEQALRECLLDCEMIIENYRDGKRFDHMGSFDGQVKALQRDIRNILNREDCPNYNFKKDKPNG